MSIEAINWALNRVVGISSTQKAILVALADRADAEGCCFPSYQDICARSCATRNAVANALKTFEELGLVSRERRFSKSTVYRLLISTEIRTSGSSSIENDTIISTENDTISSTVNRTLTTTITTKEPSYMSRWSEFWKKYPSSKNKKKSESIFRNLSVKDQKAAIAALDGYEFSSDKRYIPMASTWLNGRRWEDEQDNDIKSGGLEL